MPPRTKSIIVETKSSILKPYFSLLSKNSDNTDFLLFESD